MQRLEEGDPGRGFGPAPPPFAEIAGEQDAVRLIAHSYGRQGTSPRHVVRDELPDGLEPRLIEHGLQKRFEEVAQRSRVHRLVHEHGLPVVAGIAVHDVL
jgi:hypothetical protein